MAAFLFKPLPLTHYCGVIMDTMASQITRLTIVYSTVYSEADQRKHRSSASLAFVCEELTGDRGIPRANGQLRGKCFHLMTSSWCMPYWIWQSVRQHSVPESGEQVVYYTVRVTCVTPTLLNDWITLLSLLHIESLLPLFLRDRWVDVP